MTSDIIETAVYSPTQPQNVGLPARSGEARKATWTAASLRSCGWPFPVAAGFGVRAHRSL